MKIEKIEDISIYNPKAMTDAQLRDDWRIVSAWYATAVEGGDIKYSKEEIIDFVATKLLPEIMDREIIEFNPSEEKEHTRELLYAALQRVVQDGIYLVEPHGKWIAEGEKKTIIKAKVFEGELNKPLYVCSAERIYGVIKLKTIQPIGLEEFEESKTEHKISDEERQEWWPNKKKLFAYDFYLVVPFPEPWSFDQPTGAQTFIKEVKVTAVPAQVQKDIAIIVEFHGTKGLVDDTSPTHKEDTLLVIDSPSARVMIDCGETWKEKDLPVVDLIVLTHAHPDHVRGLEGRKIDVPVYMTGETDSLLDRGKFPLNRVIVDTSKWIEAAGILVKFIPVSHSVKVPTSIVQFNVAGFGILVATDVLSIPERDSILGATNLYIGDGTALEKDMVRQQKDSGLAYGHSSIRRQLRWLTKSPVQLAIFTHFGTETIEMGDDELKVQVDKLLEDTGYDGSILIAQDGFAFKLTSKEVKEGEEYGRSYFSGQHSLRDYDVESYVPVISRLSGGTILEVGCGLGKLLNILRASGYDTSGIDASDFALSECKRKGFKVQKSSAEDLPFEDESFDSVISTHLLEHVPDFEKAFKESIRVAKFRAIHLVPLGPSRDFTHKHIFKSHDDLREKLGKFTEYPMDISGGGSGLGKYCATAVITVYKDLGICHNEALKFLGDFLIIPDFISLVGGTVKKEQTDDLDVCFRTLFPGSDIKFRNQLSEELQEVFHPVLNPSGPHDAHIPLYDLWAIKKKQFEVRHIEKQKKLRPLQYFTPLKTKSGYTLQEFGTSEEFWEKWAKPLIDLGIAIDMEKKFNGWRSILEKDEKAGTLIFFAETKKNRSKQFPAIVEELKAIEGGVILDADMGAVFSGGTPVPRRDLAAWGVEGEGTELDGTFVLPSGEKATVAVNVFDILYYEGEDLHTLTWEERRAKLEEFFGKYDFKFLQLVKKNIVRTKPEIESTGSKLSKEPGSEGYVAKSVVSDYPLTGQSAGWSKVKNEAEFKVQVTEKIPVKGSTTIFNYRIGYLDEDGELAELGKTFNTSLSVPDGTIITITASEVTPEFDKKTEKWKVGAVLPKVMDAEPGLKKPENIGQIISRAYQYNILQATPAMIKELKDAKLLLSKAVIDILINKATGQLSFKEGDSGDGVLQTHERGLTQEQTELTSEFGWKPIKISTKELEDLNVILKADWEGAIDSAAEESSKKLMDLIGRIEVAELNTSQKRLIAKVDPISIHSDLRLHPAGKDYWEGGTGYTPGNQFQENKFRFIAENPDEGSKVKILGGFKAPREGEAEGETEPVIRGPLIWLGYGIKNPEVFPPGTPGATSKAWGRITNRDQLKWWAGIQDEHYKEFWFEGGVLKGRWIFGYVPTAAGVRQWMISRPAKQMPDSEFLREKFGEKVEKGKDFKWYIPIVKADEERKLVYGVVLQPGIQDAQGDIAEEGAIEKACHEFMKKSQIIGVGHKSFAESKDLKIVECYIAPADLAYGDEKVVKGSWMMVVYVDNPRIWKMVKEGKLTGFSVSGSALGEALAA